jgi:hypothetical protein
MPASSASAAAINGRLPRAQQRDRAQRPDVRRRRRGSGAVALASLAAVLVAAELQARPAE